MLINDLYVNRLEGCVDKEGKDYSIIRLAEKAGISRQQAYKILSGSSIPRVDTAIKICLYITELFGYEITVSDLWIIA